jgi:hypothetical protein
MTVCLYFVPPHRVKPIDWIMMAAISRHVALIPIIAKADSFTAFEMKSFREELLQVINAAGGAGAAGAVSGEDAGSGDGSLDVGNSSSEGAALAPSAAAAGVGSGSSSSSNRGQQATPVNGSSSRTHGFLSARLMQEQLGDGDIADMSKLAKDLSLQTYFFSDESLTQLDARHHVMPPFAVVSSSEMVPSSTSSTSSGSTIAADGNGSGDVGDNPGRVSEVAEYTEQEPGRQYSWGTCYPYDRDHSDLIILKQLLFGYWNAAIYDLLDNSYDQAVKFARRLEREEEGTLSKGERIEKMVEEGCDGIVPQLQNEEQKQLHVALEREKQKVGRLEEEMQQQLQNIKLESEKMNEQLKRRDELVRFMKRVIALFSAPWILLLFVCVIARFP